jgi:hypothetical protein
VEIARQEGVLRHKVASFGKTNFPPRVRRLYADLEDEATAPLPLGQRSA